MEKLSDTAEKLVETLTEDHKYSDAAEIEYQFLGNVEASIKLYCKQYWYDHAILLAEKSKKPELIESIVDVQINEGFGVIAELLADCKGQMNSQLKRLRELRTKSKKIHFSFYGTPDDLDTLIMYRLLLLKHQPPHHFSQDILVKLLVRPRQEHLEELQNKKEKKETCQGKKRYYL